MDVRSTRGVTESLAVSQFRGRILSKAGFEGRMRLGHFKGSFKGDQEMRSSFPEFEGSNSSQTIPRFIASCMTFPNVTATAATSLEATAGSPTGLAGGPEGRGLQLVEFWWIQPHLSMLLNPKHITFTKHTFAEMCFFSLPYRIVSVRVRRRYEWLTHLAVVCPHVWTEASPQNISKGNNTLQLNLYNSFISLLKVPCVIF